MNPFQKIATASAKNRRKQLERTISLKGKHSNLKDRRDKRKFGNLNHGSTLTHKGKELDFDNLEDIGWQSDDEEELDLNDPNIQRRETLNEVIAKHKEAKSIRQQERREMQAVVSKLNDDFKEVKRAIKDVQAVTTESDEYDLAMNSLAGDRRAQAVERTKSINEIVMEEAKKLKSSTPDDELSSVSEENQSNTLEVTYSADGKGTLKGQFKEENNDDSSSDESIESEEIEEYKDQSIPDTFTQFEEQLLSNSDVGNYIRKCRVLHFTDNDQLVLLLDHLLCFTAYNPAAITYFDGIYPHLFSLIHEFPQETATRFGTLFQSFLSKEGCVSERLTGNLLLLCQLCTKLFQTESSGLSAIFNIIGKHLLAPVTSKACVDIGIRTCKLLSPFCNEHFIFFPELYIFAFRYFKTIDYKSLLFQAVDAFDYKELSPYKNDFEAIIKTIDTTHPCYELYTSLSNIAPEEYIKHPLRMQIFKKEQMKMQTPIFGDVKKSSENTKLKKRLKNESKSLLRQIRKDGQFIQNKKVEEIKRKDKDYQKFINKVTADLGRESSKHQEK